MMRPTFRQLLVWRELRAGGATVAELARASGADERTVAWACTGVAVAQRPSAVLSERFATAQDRREVARA